MSSAKVAHHRFNVALFLASAATAAAVAQKVLRFLYCPLSERTRDDGCVYVASCDRSGAFNPEQTALAPD